MNDQLYHLRLVGQSRSEMRTASRTGTLRVSTEGIDTITNVLEKNNED